MARSYSERIENMDDEARAELDSRIRAYEGNNGWQKTLGKFKASPMQLRAILAGKDARKAKPKKSSKKKASKKAGRKKAAKKKVTKKKAAKKKSAKKSTKKKVKKVAKKTKIKVKAAPKKPGRPKKKDKANGVVTKVNAKGDLIIEGTVDAAQFVEMVFTHSERLVAALRS